MMAASGLPRGTVTFVFTDIEGSTALARRLGRGYGRVRSEHRRLLREAFGRHGGHEIDTAGDGFFVVFERAGDAVAAAVDAQRALSESDAEQPPPVRVRMGLHTAEPYLDDHGYVGVGVSRAARICAAGHGGQILLSNATAGIVEDLGLVGVTLRDLGEHRLKDIEGPQRLFQVVAPGLSTEFPRPRSLDVPNLRPRIVTLLLVDLTGWRRVLRALGDEKAAAAAAEYHSIAIKAITAHDGNELEIVADTVLAAFDRPRDALAAAVSLRDALRTEHWFPEGDPPIPRMAIHSGRVANPAGRHLGSVGLRCVLLADDADAGQILVSHATEALLEGEPLEVALRDLGERTLPDDDRAARVFEVDTNEAPSRA